MVLLRRQSNLETNFSVASSFVLTRNRLSITLKVKFLMPQPHSTQGLSPGGGHCVVFWDKAIYFHRASFHLGMRMGTRSIKNYNTPVSPPGRRNRVKPGGSRRRFTYRTEMNCRTSHISWVIY